MMPINPPHRYATMLLSIALSGCAPSVQPNAATPQALRIPIPGEIYYACRPSARNAPVDLNSHLPRETLAKLSDAQRRDLQFTMQHEVNRHIHDAHMDACLREKIARWLELSGQTETVRQAKTTGKEIIYVVQVNQPPLR